MNLGSGVSNRPPSAHSSSDVADPMVNQLPGAAAVPTTTDDSSPSSSTTAAYNGGSGRISDWWAVAVKTEADS